MLSSSVLARPGALLRATGIAARRFQATFSPRHTYTELTRWVMPSYTNKCGVARGGKIMAWIDICAAIASGRLCNASTVTASMDALEFRHPIRNGDIVTLRGRVNRSFKSSMEVEVEVLAEPMKERGRRHHCVSALLTFVALGPDRKRVPVPELFPETRVEEEAWEAAGQRRAERLKAKTHTPLVVDERPQGSGLVAAGGGPLPASVPASCTFSESVHWVMPQHANSLNTTFGGQMMAWAEDLAAISATRLSRLDMVTARVDAMHFKAPSFVGEVITAQSQVNRVFKTSVDVGVRLLATDVHTGQSRVCLDASMVFAAMPPPGATRADLVLPKVEPSSPSEHARYTEAAIRREQRGAAV